MRVVLLCTALAAGTAFAGDLVARQGGDSVRLAEAPCKVEKVLSQLEPKLQEKYREATATVQGRTFAACWRMTPAGAHLMYEDGDQGLVPTTDLKPELTA